MRIKLFLIILTTLILGGCFSKQTKIPAEIQDKSSFFKQIYAIPVAGKIIKNFSKKHPGVTFYTQPNMPIRAIRDGKVIASNNTEITIKHRFGFYSFYVNSQPKVKIGDEVKKEQIIADTGKTNFYFAMKKFKTLINPIKYLKTLP